jgi:plasmid maintenance system killer protein
MRSRQVVSSRKNENLAAEFRRHEDLRRNVNTYAQMFVGDQWHLIGKPF